LVIISQQPSSLIGLRQSAAFLNISLQQSGAFINQWSSIIGYHQSAIFIIYWPLLVSSLLQSLAFVSLQTSSTIKTHQQSDSINNRPLAATQPLKPLNANIFPLFLGRIVQFSLVFYNMLQPNFI